MGLAASLRDEKRKPLPASPDFDGRRAGQGGGSGVIVAPAVTAAITSALRVTVPK